MTSALFVSALWLLAAPAAATKLLERGCKYFPKSARLWLAQGVAHYGQRRFGDAAGAFILTIDIAPEVQQPYAMCSAPEMPAIAPLDFPLWNASGPRPLETVFTAIKERLAL